MAWSVGVDPHLSFFDFSGMADLFPPRLTAGLTFRHTVVQAAYPAPDWVLSAVLRGPGAYTLRADGEGAAHRFHAAANVTAAWLHGTYAYSVRASRGADIVELSSGTIEIAPDLAQVAAGHDARSHVERVLAAIEAVIEKRATIDQERYRINNRELWRTPVGELLRLRDRYKADLARMKAARRGELFGRTVRVAFR